MIHTSYIKEGKIDTSDEGIAYWAGKLNCSRNDLQDSILKIGNTYNTLLLYMEMNRLINTIKTKDNLI